MNVGDFDRMMNQVAAIFGRKVSDETRVRIWRKVEHADIPSRQVDAILSRLDDLDDPPKNLGKTILAVWRSMDAGTSADVPNGCDFCDGPRRGGFITYAKQLPNGRFTIYAGACSSCYPGHKYVVEKEKLRAAGYDLCMSSDRAAQSEWWTRIQRANTAHLTCGEGCFKAVNLKDIVRAAAARESDRRES